MQDAIDNAQDGDVLVLSGNMEGDGAVVPSGKNITINLNGYTYTVSGELVGSIKSNSFKIVDNIEGYIKKQAKSFFNLNNKEMEKYFGD